MKKIVFSFFFLTLPLFLFCQKNDISNRKVLSQQTLDAYKVTKSNLDKGLNILDSLEQTAIEQYGEMDSLTADVLYYKGFVLRNSEHKKAISFFDEAFKTRNKLYPSKHSKNYTLAYHAGRCASKIKADDTSIKYLNFFLKNYDKNSKWNKYLFSVYYTLAQSYKNKGDYHLAEDYYNIAKNHTNNLDYKSNCITELSGIRFELKDTLKALNYIEEFQDFEEKDLYVKARKETLLGEFYDKKGNYDTAISHFKIAEKVYLKNNDIENLSNIYNDMAISYKKGKKHKEAITILNNTIKKNQQVYNVIFDPYLSSFYNNLADNYTQLKKDKKALEANHIALQQLIPKYRETKLYTSIGLDKMPIVGLKNEALIILDSLASNYKTLYLKNKTPKNLTAALNAYEQAIALIDIMRSEHSEESSMLFWREETRELYQRAIEVALLADKKEKAFAYCEKSKAALLLDALKEVEATDFIPEELVQQEQKLQQEIANLELQDTSLQVIVDKKEILTQFIDELEEQYPKYHAYKYDTKTDSILDVQTKLLDDNTTLIEYFLAEKMIYAFVIDKNTSRVEQIPCDSTLTNKISRLVKLLADRKAIDTGTQFEEYLNISNRLYLQLIAPLNLQPDRKLILIPDGILNYIPFETLCKNTDKNNPQYLVLNHTMSYSYSSTILAKNKDRKNDDYSGQVLAVAPVHFDFQVNSDSLAPLTKSATEVDGILSYFKGKKQQATNATKAAFEIASKDYQIIHLSTHAAADSIPWIAFSDTLLYLPEVYNLDLNADMVVLSACETSRGDLQTGEGVMSIARGFAYAGVPSTLTTMWEVNEEAAKNMMELFYGYLKEGKPKDEALHQAKLDYIATSDNPSDWAAFIHVGNTNPLKLDQAINKSLYLLAIPLFFFLGFWLFKKRK